MYKFKITYDVNEEEWDSYLKNSPNSSFFQSANFLQIQNKNKIPVFIHIFDQYDKIKCQLGLAITKTYSPYSTRKLNRFTELISKFGNRATWVSGPIIFSNDKEIRIRILQTLILALEEFSLKNNLVIIDGYTPPMDILVNKEYLNEFIINGYRNENFTTFVLDLSKSLEEIWNNVSKKAKNDVTRAKRRNVTVKEIKNYEDFIDFRKLIKVWGETKGIDISEQNEFVEKDWELYQKGIQKFFLAFQENEVISGLRVGTFNGIAYTHQVLNTYSKSTSLGGSLLTWYAIEWAKNNNMRIYDLSGVKSEPKNSTELKKHNSQWKGLTEYKKKWGGDELEYYHLIKTRKSIVYKLFRLLSRPDYLYREYKRKHFDKPLKSKINTR